MALLSFPYGMEQGWLPSSALCALWSLLRGLERLSSASKLRLCVLVLLGKKHSKTDFLAPRCPVSSSALIGFFRCIEYKLSNSVHVPEKCQFDPVLNSLLDVCGVVA